MTSFELSVFKFVFQHSTVDRQAENTLDCQRVFLIHTTS